jgi:hypothetical protein
MVCDIAIEAIELGGTISALYRSRFKTEHFNIEHGTPRGGWRESVFGLVCRKQCIFQRG